MSRTKPQKSKTLTLNESVSLAFACGGDVFLKADEAARLFGYSRRGFEEIALRLGISPVDINDLVEKDEDAITRCKRYSLRQILTLQHRLIRARDERDEEIRNFVRDAIENLQPE